MDISQFYNWLNALAFLILLLVLRRVLSQFVDTGIKTGYVVPCLTCVPMGAYFEVALAQAVSGAALRRIRLSVEEVDSNFQKAVDGGAGSRML